MFSSYLRQALQGLCWHNHACPRGFPGHIVSDSQVSSIAKVCPKLESPLQAGKLGSYLPWVSLLAVVCLGHLTQGMPVKAGKHQVPTFAEAFPECCPSGPGPCSSCKIRLGDKKSTYIQATHKMFRRFECHGLCSFTPCKVRVPFSLTTQLKMWEGGCQPLSSALHLLLLANVGRLNS